MPEISGVSGSQRHSLERLRAWEALGHGMFIHFGMSTFDGDEYSQGDKPSSLYAPDKLDVDQWVNVARDAGMKYAVLTTKHVSGHCLWPSRLTDYHVGTSGNKTDVLDAFVRACERAGVIPGFYYCSWDNHHLLGSVTPNSMGTPPPFEWNFSFASERYCEFQMAQIEELGSNYGKIGEYWIDVPNLLPHSFRRQLYARLAELQPDTMIVMNQGLQDGRMVNRDNWPADALTIETDLPKVVALPGDHHLGYDSWKEVMGEKFYVPGEVCDTTKRHWFWLRNDPMKSDAELLGVSLLARSRGCNILLNVGPDPHGLVPPEQVEALMRLRANRERLG